MKTPTFRITLFFAVLALLCPLLLHANDMDRDMLLAPDGTLYTVESVAPESLGHVTATSKQALVLTLQNATGSTAVPVPASLQEGYHFAPALAYDSATSTLFIFWETMRNGGFTSDLTFCSYHDGEWGTAATLDTVAWDLRLNLRIAITRKTEQKNAAGEISSIPEVTVHATWWQQSGDSEWARYAMIPTDNGNVRLDAVQVRDLSSFLTSAPAASTAAPSNNELLRHPLIIESATHDTVDVVFGDISNNSMHRVTLKPIANGRLRIPIGVKEGGIETPHAIVDSATTTAISGLSATDGSITYYFNSADTVKYLSYKGDTWTPLRSITLSDKLSSEAAVSALRRMTESQ